MSDSGSNTVTLTCRGCPEAHTVELDEATVVHLTLAAARKWDVLVREIGGSATDANTVILCALGYSQVYNGVRQTEADRSIPSAQLAVIVSDTTFGPDGALWRGMTKTYLNPDAIRRIFRKLYDQLESAAATTEAETAQPQAPDTLAMS